MSESTSRVSTDGSGYVKSSPTSTRSQVDAEDDDRGNIASETGHTLSETEPYRLPFRTSHLQVDYQEPRRIGSGQSSVSLGATTTTEPSAETANLPQTRKQSTWTLPSLPFSRASTQTTQSSFSARPKISFSQCSSLDNILRYREGQTKRKHSCSTVQLQSGPQTIVNQEASGESPPRTPNVSQHGLVSRAIRSGDQSTFRHPAAELGFCFTVMMSQLVAEYLISGFASALPKLLAKTGPAETSMGAFWPASLLLIVLSAMLLVFARLSDMHSGYPYFMFGLAWLAVWTLIPGFAISLKLVDAARAMQGLAIAAFQPSTFTIIGGVYPEGRRKNLIMGFYSGCAPVGFLLGMFTAAALPPEKLGWYFWIASALSCIVLVMAFLTVPADRTERRELDLEMDWRGVFCITSGLMLISYALSVEPWASARNSTKSGFASATVLAPLSSGVVTLIAAFWYEGWIAQCPLLPFDFFRPKNVKSLVLASLCFYATYGAWLFNSAEFFSDPEASPGHDGLGMNGIELAFWYLPTAAGGLILCTLSGWLMHIIPIMALVFISAMAWVVAPLVLALAPLPLNYWKSVFVSMLCASTGIDLTFTVSIVFISAVQPLRYKGLTGAICSLLVNLGMSFGLSISEIASSEASAKHELRWEYKAAFIYGAVSAGLGLLICVVFLRISRSTMTGYSAAQGSASVTSSELRLVSGTEADILEAGRLNVSP